MASQEIEALSAALARLPGLGPRSARRAVLWLIKRRETALVHLLDALESVREGLVECQTCGNVDTTNPCGVCTDSRRDQRFQRRHCEVGRAHENDLHAGYSISTQTFRFKEVLP